MAEYYTLLTTLGRNKLAEAQALGTQIELTHMAVGDGNGKLPQPKETQTKLINQKYKGAINKLELDPKNKAQFLAELIIKEDVGDFWVREVGLFLKDGTLFAVGNCPESYKPLLSSGSARTLTIRTVIHVSSADSVTLKIDPSVVLATRAYVDNEIKKLGGNLKIPKASTRVQGITKLSNDTNSDSQTEAATPKAVKTAFDKAEDARKEAGKARGLAVEAQKTADNKADKNHKHDFKEIQNVPKATTSVQGIVKLSNTTNSDSQTEAATPKAVKTAFDKAEDARKEAGKARGLAVEAQKESEKKLPLIGGTLTGRLVTPEVKIDNPTKAWANIAYKNNSDIYWLSEASGDKFRFIRRDKDNTNLNVYYLPALPEGKNSTLLTDYELWKSGYKLIGNTETESNVLSIFERGNYSSSSIANKWKHLPQGCSNRFNLIVSGTTQNRTCTRLEIHDMVSNKRWVNANTSTDESKAAWTGWSVISVGGKLSSEYLDKSDLDTIIEEGFYYQDTNDKATKARHYPAESAGSLQVIKAAGITQLYKSYTGSSLWFRNNYGNKWSEWETLGVDLTTNYSGKSTELALSQKGANDLFNKLKAMHGQGFTQNFKDNGWCKLPNGFLVQWGSSDSGSLKFPIPFKNVYSVSHSKTGDGRDTHISSISNTGFTSHSTGNLGKTYYIAVGL